MSDTELEKVLILDDNSDYRKLIKTFINKLLPGVETIEYDSVFKGIPDDSFNWSEIDVLLLDYHLSIVGTTGLDILHKHHKKNSFPATIMLTGAGTEEIAIRALKSGIYEYQPKQSLTKDKLKQSIIHAWEEKKSERKKKQEATQHNRSFSKEVFYESLEKTFGQKGVERALVIIKPDNIDVLEEEIGIIGRDNLVNHIAKNSFEVFKLGACNPNITRISDTEIGVQIDYPINKETLEFNMQGLCKHLTKCTFKFSEEKYKFSISIGVLKLGVFNAPAEQLIYIASTACQHASSTEGNSHYIWKETDVIPKLNEQPTDKEPDLESIKEKGNIETELKAADEEKKNVEAIIQAKKKAKEKLEAELKIAAETKEKAEAELKIAAEAKEKAEAEAKTLAEKEVRRNAESEFKAQEEIKLRAVQKEKEEAELKIEEEAKAKDQALLRADQEAQQRAKAELKTEEEEKAKDQALLRADQEAQQRAKAELKTEEEEKAKDQALLRADQEAHQRAEAELKTEEEAKAKDQALLRADQATQQRVEAELKIEEETKAKDQALLRADQEAQQRVEAELKIEEETKAKDQALLRADQEAKEKAEAELKAMTEEKAKFEAELRAEHETQQRIEAELRAENETEAKLQAEQEMKLVKEAKEKLETELKAAAEAKEKAEEEMKLAKEAKEKLEVELKALIEARVKSEEEIKKASSNLEAENSNAADHTETPENSSTKKQKGNQTENDNESQENDSTDIKSSELLIQETEVKIRKLIDEKRIIQTYQAVTAMFEDENEIKEIYKTGLQAIVDDDELNQYLSDTSVFSISLQQIINEWVLRQVFLRITESGTGKCQYLFLIQVTESWFSDIALFTWLQKILEQTKKYNPGKSIILEVPLDIFNRHKKRAQALIDNLHKSHQFSIALSNIHTFDNISDDCALSSSSLLMMNIEQLKKLTESLMPHSEEEKEKNEENSGEAAKQNMLQYLKSKGIRIITSGIEDSTLLMEAITAGTDYTLGNFVGEIQDNLVETGAVESFELT